MNVFAKVSGLLTRAATGRAEGERLTTPLAPVRYPDPGLIPMSWPLNYWQCGLDPIAPASASIVDACVWAYIRAIAQLPGFHMQEDADGGREASRTSALSRVLRIPNAYQTRSDCLTHAIRSLLYDGNWYSLAVRNARAEVAELHYINPRAVKVRLVKIPGQRVNEVFYELQDNANPLLNLDDFKFDGRIFVPARDMLHVKLMCPDNPLKGESWLTMLWFELASRGAISSSMSTFFTNAARPSGVLLTDAQLSQQQMDALRDRWIRQTTGQNAGGTPILSHGLKWEQTGISQRDSQVVDALKLSDRQLCGVFGVPGILVGVEDSKPFASTEAINNYWLANGLGWLLDHIEVQIDQFFGLGQDEWTEFDTEALLRTELGTRIDALVKGVQGGIYAPNEARAKEGYPGVEAGDEPRVQQQVVPLSFALEPAPAPQPPAAPSAPPPADEGEDDAQKLFELVAAAKGFEAYEQSRFS